METANTSPSYPGFGLQLFSLLVPDYDAAIEFYVSRLGFTLVEDKPALTSDDGQPKRWVIVRPPDVADGFAILLAQARGPVQEDVLSREGGQFGGRVGLFWRVKDFESIVARLRANGVALIGEVRREEYGRLIIFKDHVGNRWDLVGPV